MRAARRVGVLLWMILVLCVFRSEVFADWHCDPENSEGYTLCTNPDDPAPPRDEMAAACQAFCITNFDRPAAGSSGGDGSMNWQCLCRTRTSGGDGDIGDGGGGGFCGQLGNGCDGMSGGCCPGLACDEIRDICCDPETDPNCQQSGG